MSFDHELKALFIDWWVGEANRNNIISWAVNQLGDESHTKYDRELTTLVRSNLNTESGATEFYYAIDMLMEKASLGAFQGTQEAQEMAKSRWKEQLEFYIQRKLTPLELLERLTQHEAWFDFPSYLGEMYGALDWSDESTTFDNAPHIAECARETLGSL